MACRLFGLGHLELIGKKLSDFVKEEPSNDACDSEMGAGPAILCKSMFNTLNDLEPVHGKAVSYNCLIAVKSLGFVQ